MKSIACRFIKKEKIAEVKGPKGLLEIDALKPNDLLPISAINIGFGAASQCKKMKESDVNSFRLQCREFLQILFIKLATKSPLKKQMVKGASCLSPTVMLNENVRTYRVSAALNEFVDKKYISAIDADHIKRCYSAVCSQPLLVSKLKTYDWKKDRLDDFLIKNLPECDSTFLNFIKRILIMFHGNADVERSFSVNKEGLLENLQENALIAQRCIYSAISSCGGIENVRITKSMMLAVRNASSKRQDALKEKKKHQDEKELTLKNVAEDLRKLQDKKKRIAQNALDEAEAVDAEIELVKKKLRKS